MKPFFVALFATLLSAVPASAFSATSGPAKSDFDFTFFGNSAGRYTMVSCDYAEDLVRAWMDDFGATDLDVRCIGGIEPYGRPTPLSLHVTYTAPSSTAPTREERISIESGAFPGQSNCDFDTTLMRSLLNRFPNVRIRQQYDACFDPQSSYRYDLIVTLGS